MIKIWKTFGTIIYYALIPFWILYFKFSSTRTRVVITHGSKVLLIKNWLSKNEWALPGGGVKSKEDPKDSACREVYEEVGFTINPDKITKLANRKNKAFGFKYNAVFYIYHASKLHKITKQFPEILEAKWVNISDLDNFTLSKETKFIVNRLNSISKQ